MEYVPHPIVGAINQNSPQGVIALDEKMNFIIEKELDLELIQGIKFS